MGDPRSSTPTVATGPHSGGQTPRRRYARRVVAGSFAVLVFAALVAAGWWRTHPTAFDSYLGVSITNHIGVPALLPLSAQPDSPTAEKTVAIEAVRPRIAHAPVGAQVSAWVCHNSKIGTPGGANAGRGRLAPNCSEVVPAAGAVVHLGGGSRDIIMLRVNSTRRGAVIFDGVDVRYRSGLQNGTQSFPDYQDSVTFK